jgi:hypothetical protein
MTKYRLLAFSVLWWRDEWRQMLLRIEAGGDMSVRRGAYRLRVRRTAAAQNGALPR